MNKTIDLLPRPAADRAQRTLRGALHVLRGAAYLSPLWLPNALRLHRYRGRFTGERCWIIGNGPSLNRTPLECLEDEFTFGLNRIYLKYDEMGYQTTFLVSVNDLVSEQFAGEIEQTEATKFIGWNNNRHYDARYGDDDLIYVRSRPGPAFCDYPPIQGVWEGATVTYVAMQLAFFMGFERVVLVGVDHSFDVEGPAHQEVVSSSDDANHFDPEYFGEGVRWQLPDLQTSEYAYRLARERFDAAGGKIVDATIDGELDVFPKVECEEVV